MNKTKIIDIARQCSVFENTTNLAISEKCIDKFNVFGALEHIEYMSDVSPM